MPARAPPPPAVPGAGPRTTRDGGWTAAPDAPTGRPAVPRWSRGTRDHRRPARPRPARPAVVDSRWRSWPEDHLAALPRGISRHVVRFVKVSGRGPRGQGDQGRPRPAASTTCCGSCRQLDLPCVEPVRRRQRPHRPPTASRSTPACSPGTCSSRCPTARCSARRCGPTPRQRLIDALAVLLVRLHLDRLLVGRRVAVQHPVPPRRRRLRGLPRRRRDRRAARDQLSDGQREHDLDIARVNIAGELMDLEAGGLPRRGRRPDRDLPAASSTATASLWDELTGRSASSPATGGASSERIRRLNELGFDVDELAISTDIDGTDDPDPAQGRRRRPPLAAAAAPHRARRRGEPGPPPAQRPRRLPRRAPTARTTTRRSSPTTGWPGSTSRSSAPCRATWPRKLEPAELFHEVLEHRWYMSERAGHDIPIDRRAAATTWPPCCRPSRTRRRSSASTRWRCRSWRCSRPATGRAAASSTTQYGGRGSHDRRTGASSGALRGQTRCWAFTAS